MINELQCKILNNMKKYMKGDEKFLTHLITLPKREIWFVAYCQIVETMSAGELFSTLYLEKKVFWKQSSVLTKRLL